MCFYADSAFAFALWIMTSLCAAGMEDASLKPVKQNILGIFFHGCGHLWIGYDQRMDQRTGWEVTRGDFVYDFIPAYIIGFLFWYFLTIAGGLKDALGNYGHLPLVTSVTLFQFFFVPGILSFAFVGTTLITLSCLSQLLKKEKTRFYNAESVICVTPVVFMAWIEALTCDTFLMNVGGHLWYDLTIPISFTVFFFYVKKQQVSGEVSGFKSKVKED